MGWGGLGGGPDAKLGSRQVPALKLLVVELRTIGFAEPRTLISAKTNHDGELNLVGNLHLGCTRGHLLLRGVPWGFRRILHRESPDWRALCVLPG